MNAEKRLWCAVILQAMYDLNCTNKVVQKEAREFLKNKDGALEIIAEFIGISHEKITEEYRRRGNKLGSYCKGLLRLVRNDRWV